MQTFKSKLLAEPPEGVFLYVAQSRRINASAEVELHSIELGKIGLLTHEQVVNTDAYI